MNINSTVTNLHLFYPANKQTWLYSQNFLFEGEYMKIQIDYPDSKFFGKSSNPQIYVN